MKSYEFLSEDTESYEIQRGDNLTKIARDHGTTIDAIMDLNRGNPAIRDRDMIYRGGIIKLPKTSTGFDPGTRSKRQGAPDTTAPTDIGKIGNQQFPMTPAPKPGPNDDMGGENFGITDKDWEFPTIELGFGDPGYTPLITTRLEKHPDGKWYRPGDWIPMGPDVAAFADKRLKDLARSPKSPDISIPSVSSKPSSGQTNGVKPDMSPIPGAWVTDRFGSSRIGRSHQGIDLHADIGTPVQAPNDSKVLDVGYGPTKGNYIILGDKQGHRTHQFMHLSKTFVDPGDTVEQGQVIAKSGNSGLSPDTGSKYPPHLHWEKYVDGKPVDPAKFVTLPKKS